MDMKRFLVLGVLGMFLISMMGLVLGAGELEGLESVSDSKIKEVFSDIKDMTWGNLEFTNISDNSGDYIGWIYALLLGMIIYTVISTFFAKSSKMVQWTITGTITALAMLGIPGEVIASFAASYGAMGSAILAIIPFAIVFWFSIKVDSLPLAKGVWVFFALYYLTFMFIGFNDPKTEAWPYVIGFIGACAMFYFMGFFRKKDSKWALEGEIETATLKHNKRMAASKQYDKIIGDVAGIPVTGSRAD